MVEELFAGGHGDILGDTLGVPPTEVKFDDYGMIIVNVFYQTISNLPEQSCRSTWEPEHYVHCSV